MSVLVLGMALFFATHSISIVSPAWRDGIAHKLGEQRWRGIYVAAALAGFALMVWGYGLARQEPVVLYVAPMWLRHVAVLLLIFVFPLLFATYLPGRIQTLTRHPMLAAVKIWAFAHLLANGTLADVALFGSFLAWAVADRISLKRRQDRAVPGAPPAKWNDLVAIGAGLVVYLIFMQWMHVWLMGVSPL
jgi:uncharacterized membrane protein